MSSRLKMFRPAPAFVGLLPALIERLFPVLDGRPLPVPFRRPLPVPAGGLLPVLLAATFLSIPLPSSAQTVFGHLVEAESGAPVEGALVLLLDEDGREIDGYLSNAAGLFALHTAAPGTYTVSAQRIGYETVVSRPVVLQADTTVRLRLETSFLPVSLGEIRVEGDQRCVIRPSEGEELARVWEEARKGLAAQDWTAREDLFEYRVSNYERELDREGRVVIGEKRENLARYARVPYRSLPAEELLADGFVQQLEDGTFDFFAPDAAVLLSDAFLDTHCFRLASSEEEPGLVGLSFEPARAGRTPDVEGSLWLDRETAELRRLEYRYTSVPYPGVGERAQGLVEFEALPTGAWIVKRWWIRMPTVAPFRNDLTGLPDEYRIIGITETGGEVKRIESQHQQIPLEVVAGTLTGLVWDSLRNGPLQGASVYLSGTSHVAETDRDGRFVMEGLPTGVYRAAFTHPVLDSLGVYPGPVTVEIEHDAIARADLGLPASGIMHETLCPGDAGTVGHGALTGTVRLAASDHPLPEASVEVRWSRDKDGEEDVWEWARTGTDSDGKYLLCGLPSDRHLWVQASLLDHEGTTQRIRIQDQSILPLDLALHIPQEILTVRTTAEGLPPVAGPQGIQGKAVDPRTGDPVRAAEIVVRRPEGTVLGTEVTNQQGFFRITTPVPGRFSLTATALGYGDVSTDSLDVAEGQLTVVQIEMTPAPLNLDPIVVVSERRQYNLEIHGFYQRAREGFGDFITPEEIEERQPVDMVDLLGRIPGLRLSQTFYGTRVLMFRPDLLPGRDRGVSADGQCEPRLYVDGLPIHQVPHGPASSHFGTYPDDVVRATQISAVEVHRRSTGLPLAYGGSSGNCGAILIWTKGG